MEQVRIRTSLDAETTTGWGMIQQEGLKEMGSTFTIFTEREERKHH